MTIRCGSNEVINVKEAWYGRNGTDCSTDPDKSLQIIKDRCQLKTSCNIMPTNTVFGDPCHGVVKKLYLSYQCDQGKNLQRIAITKNI